MSSDAVSNGGARCPKCGAELIVLENPCPCGCGMIAFCERFVEENGCDYEQR